MSKKVNLPVFLALVFTLCLVWTFLSIAGDKSGTLDNDPTLAGWWKFDETSGNIASDFSKHNRQGTLMEGLSFNKNSTPGRISKALKFNGKGFVEIKGYKGITGTKPRTVAVWIKTENDKGEIISWGEDDFGKMFTLRHVRRRIGIIPNGGYLYVNDKTDDNKWHHFAVVVEDVELPNLHDDVKLYLDGEPAEIHDIGLLDLWPIDTGKDFNVTIGKDFEGLIDDVRIYDRPLSEDEIRMLYNLQSDKPLSE